MASKAKLPSKQFAELFATLPPSAQQLLVEKHLAPLLDHIPVARSAAILSALVRAQSQAAQVPRLDIKAKRAEVEELIFELERDAKRALVHERSSKVEPYAEIAHSLADWLNDIWSVAYEHKTDFALAHECLMFCARVLFRMSVARWNNCKCAFTAMYFPLRIKNRAGRVVKSFRLKGAHNIEQVLLWIWRDIMLTMLASHDERITVHVPSMLVEIEGTLEWSALERILYGGKTSLDDLDANDGLEPDDECDDEEDCDEDYHDEDEDDPICVCAFHAAHWNKPVNAEIVPLRKLVVAQMTTSFQTAPSRRLYSCILALSSEQPTAKERQLHNILSTVAPTGPDALVAALEIHSYEGNPIALLSLLDTHAYLLRPRDSPTLQTAVTVLSHNPVHHARALQFLEQELVSAVLAIEQAVRASFAHIGETAHCEELAQIVKLRAGSTARRDRVERWVEGVHGPATGGVANAMALAAMMMGLPFGPAPGMDDADFVDPMGYLDMDPTDPDLEDLRDEFRPRLKDWFESWVDTAADISSGQPILVKVYKDVVEQMPYTRGADIIEEMTQRLADKPSKHYVCDAMDALSSFVKTQRKKAQVRGERKRRGQSAHGTAPNGVPDPAPPPLEAFGGLNDVD